MLQDLELIVQYPDGNGYVCRGFHQIRAQAPVFVLFDGPDADRNTAELLGRQFCEELLRHSGTIENQSMPCGSARRVISCHAMREPTCRKLLVRPVSSAVSIPPAPLSADDRWLQQSVASPWEVLAVVQSQSHSSVTAWLPPEWRNINVCFWVASATEAIPSVLQRAGIVARDWRLFISYVRNDTSPIADQLFSAMTERGFDVFLDRCSVPAGVDFQERLMQALCDKAMVVLLNSPGVDGSAWVLDEIATVKTYRLGLLELQMPNAMPRQDVDPDHRREIRPDDLEAAGGPYVSSCEQLKPDKLQEVIEEIIRVHGRALNRRRYELIDNFAAALADSGKAAVARTDGTFLVSSTSTSSNEIVVGLTPRPPELTDFCGLHQRGAVQQDRDGLLVSPAPFFVGQRQIEFSWLSGISNVMHADEGQMNRIAADL